MRVRGLVLGVVIVVVGVVGAPAAALAVEGYVPGTPVSFGGAGSGAGEFDEPAGVAANDSSSGEGAGDVYVVDKGNDRVERFSATGVFEGQFDGDAEFEVEPGQKKVGVHGGAKSGQFSSPEWVAVDNSGESVLEDPSVGDVYVADLGHNVIDKFSPEGEYITEITETNVGEPFKELRGVAVDPQGNLWAYDQKNVDEFSNTGTYTPSGSFNAEKRGAAFGSLAVDSKDGIYLVEKGGTSFKFEAGTQLFELTGGSTAVAVGVGPVSNGVFVDRGGLVELFAPFAEPHVRAKQVFGVGLVESHGVGVGVGGVVYASQRVADDVEVFGLVPLPPVVEGESFSGVGSSSAVLQAQVDPEGEPTSYFFEYGMTGAYGSVTRVESAGAGTGVVGVSAVVEGLAADTVYHFRVVVSSANGVVDGGDSVFSTFPGGVLGLPDGRGYELVSPLGDGDATVAGGTRAAGDGSRVAYTGQAPPVGGNGNNANPNKNGIFIGGDNQYVAERSGNSWGSVDVQPEGLPSVQYQAFSNDLSVGILSSSEPLLAGVPGGEDLYSRDNSGDYSLLGPIGTGYAGSTPDGSHLLLSAAGGLYESSPGGSSAVNVLPEGGLAMSAVFGQPNRGEGPDLSQAISNDGSHAFWTETGLGGIPERLFVSNNVGSAGQSSMQLDASRNNGSPGGGGRFQTATSDGREAYFIDCNTLTADSTAIPTTPTPSDCENEEDRGAEPPFRTLAGNDLYECDTETGALRDLTVDPNPGETANVVGVLGATTNGSYVYFAAGGALASGAQHQECVRGSLQERQEGITTDCNVFVVHDGGVPMFVGVVSNEEWSDWAPVVGGHSAFVASVGGELVFESRLGLTGFGAGVDEVYMFDPGSGLSCLSCNPSGVVTPPGGGARLPNSGSSTFALRDVSADGDRVFFVSSEGLVPQDENGQEDVYEWERDGTGSCERARGCLYVLSGGTSTDSSLFVDASENGDDLFLVSRAQLVPRDHGEARQVYDARVGAPPEPVPAVCTGTGCQGIPSAPPSFATPSSVTFNGVGNFLPSAPQGVVKTTVVKCKKGFVEKKNKCSKPKPKKRRIVAKKKTRAKKSGATRRAKS